LAEQGYVASKLMNKPFVEHILKLFPQKTNHNQIVGVLSRSLADVFSKYQKDQSITAYYRLLSALESEKIFDQLGVEKIILYDIPKGLMQLSRLNEFAANEALSLESQFTNKVEVRAHKLWSSLAPASPSYVDYFSAWLFRF
jgi:hypothetical protein